jgi:hypothetical protein
VNSEDLASQERREIGTQELDENDYLAYQKAVQDGNIQVLEKYKLSALELLQVKLEGNLNILQTACFYNQTNLVLWLKE